MGKGKYIQKCHYNTIKEEAHISWDLSLYAFNYTAQQSFFILLWAQ